MKVTRVRGACDPEPDCPTLYRTNHDTYLVQGYVVTDPQVLAELNVPAGESVVEVPAKLVEGAP
ncbi:hypothetical protein KIK06_09560 [Nocardiopsis sp. EMB25]|uniref:hypothetical protein n=1 Tax=Nocardiopsis sp. EMB25 TaxID=2835867 RepID=UPI002284F210|nr:hypothetical protein [Nocardiopsis sp. EMB25]MCY9784139.1 hypothetical protein [Nocardiopsis sp. EMB25]